MNTKTITKLFFAVVLTLAITMGSGIITEQAGLSPAPAVYACGNSGGGGC